MASGRMKRRQGGRIGRLWIDVLFKEKGDSRKRKRPVRNTVKRSKNPGLAAKTRSVGTAQEPRKGVSKRAASPKLRSTEGKIKVRTMVQTNPDMKEKKRTILIQSKNGTCKLERVKNGCIEKRVERGSAVISKKTVQAQTAKEKKKQDHHIRLTGDSGDYTEHGKWGVSKGYLGGAVAMPNRVQEGIHDNVRTTRVHVTRPGEQKKMSKKVQCRVRPK